MNEEIKGMVILKKRSFKVKSLSKTGSEKLIGDVIGSVDGIKYINVDAFNGRISVEYNLLKTNLQHIEEMLKKLGFELGGGFLAGLRRSWQHFTETNEYDNFAHPTAHCCGINENGTVYNDLSGAKSKNDIYTITD